MNTSTFIVNGNWHRPSSSAAIELEAHTITGTHAPFVLPIAPEPARTAASPARMLHGTTTNTIDDFFGATGSRAVRASQHGSCSSPWSELPPPPYADAELPAYSAVPDTEPVTLAMYLFKFGFLFPPFWILGTIILISPLTAPADFEPSKSGTGRQQLVQTIRDVELRWAKRCAWALLVLLVLASLAVATTIGALRS